MEKQLDYKPGSIVQLVFRTKNKIAVESRKKLAPLLNIGFPLREDISRRMGRWVVEVSGLEDGFSIHLREMAKAFPDDCIVFSFEEGEVSASLTGIIGSGSPVDLEKVTRIDVYPREVGKIKIKTSDEPAVPVPEGSKTFTDESGTGEKDPDDPANTTISAGMENLQDKVKALENEKLELMEQLRQCEEDKHKLSIDKAEAIKKQKIAEQKAKKLEQEIEEIRQNLGTHLDAVIDTAKLKKNDLDKENQLKKDELEELQKELEKLQTEREQTELDCEEAARQLADLRTRTEMDTETVLQMEDGQRLKHGTISRSLSEIEKEIEVVEKKIAMIVKWRMRVNKVVEKAILSGDGTISGMEEAGGKQDGE